MAFPPPNELDLESHGVVGDLQTVAVVSTRGDVAWWCWPRIDSPSVFGALLDADGGHWRIEPVDRVVRARQFYLSGTNVLVTRFHTAGAVVEIEDAMALDEPRRLVRRVRSVRGTVRLRCELVPRPDYGRADVDVRLDESGCAARIAGGGVDLLLRTTTPLLLDGNRPDRLHGEFELAPDGTVVFALGDRSDDQAPQDLDADVDDLIDDTVARWKGWTSRGTYRGRWREHVERSALALKLLTNVHTGGVVAAATTSLPEAIGGSRNWDYRYVWIRDAAFTVYALLAIGHVEEARAFVDWLVARVDECVDGDGPLLRPLYDLDGGSNLNEITLDHWSGYAGSTPVRVGNAAAEQEQLDVYGELIDSLYLYDKHGEGVSFATWDRIRTFVDHVIDSWEQPDHGMWEARCEPERYTSSLLMCWVAVERAMRMAQFRGRPADLERWRAARDAMHRTIADRGWNDRLGAFTQTLDGDAVDASILLAPLVKFIGGTDPRWQSTLDVLREQLAHGPLVDRYDLGHSSDGLDGTEGSFTICSFWLVEALVRADRVDEAVELFDRLLSYASPVGLFSEQIADDGRQIGNFPQAFTHLALISAAIALDEALDQESNQESS